MYRPLLIVVAFLAVTVGLILFQPERTPVPSAELETVPEPAATVEDTVKAVVAEQRTPQVDQPVPDLSINDDAAVQVTRAQSPTLEAVTPIATPEPEVQTAAPVVSLRPVPRTNPEPAQPQALFADMAKDRPNFLTATAQNADGSLRPSLLPLAETRYGAQLEGVATAVEPSSSENSASDIADSSTIVTLSAVTPTALASPTAAAVGNPDLRRKLASAPTRAVHTVRIGDSLLTLALRYYGTPNAQEYILEANRRHLGDEATLQVGQLLRIPDIENL